MDNLTNNVEGALADWQVSLQQLRMKLGSNVLSGRFVKHISDMENDERLAILDRFFREVFDQAPAEERRGLVISPLYPESAQFWERDQTLDTTSPIHIIFYLGHGGYLDKIRPVLQPKDYSILGPYQSTFLHMILCGVQNGAPKLGQARCAKVLLEEAPGQVKKANTLGTTPTMFAQYLQAELRGQAERIALLGEVESALSQS